MARLRVNVRGIASLLKSDKAQRLVIQRAERIAEAADRAANDSGGHKVVHEVGRNRARAAVVTASPKAMFKEATIRSLTSSLGAGRG